MLIKYSNNLETHGVKSGSLPSPLLVHPFPRDKHCPTECMIKYNLGKEEHYFLQLKEFCQITWEVITQVSLANFSRHGDIQPPRELKEGQRQLRGLIFLKEVQKNSHSSFLFKVIPQAFRKASLQFKFNQSCFKWSPFPSFSSEAMSLTREEDIKMKSGVIKAGALPSCAEIKQVFSTVPRGQTSLHRKRLLPGQRVK